MGFFYFAFFAFFQFWNDNFFTAKRKAVKIGIPDFEGTGDLEEVYPGWEIPVFVYFNDLGIEAKYEYDYGDEWEDFFGDDYEDSEDDFARSQEDSTKKTQSQENDLFQNHLRIRRPPSLSGPV